MNFGGNLYRFRVIKNDTVKEISSALGVSEGIYLSWESGEQEPELNELCLLAEYFMVTVDNMLNTAFDYKEYLHLLRVHGLVL